MLWKKGEDPGFVPARDSTERTNYVALAGAVAPILASTFAIISSVVAVKPCRGTRTSHPVASMRCSPSLSPTPYLER